MSEEIKDPRWRHLLEVLIDIRDELKMIREILQFEVSRGVFVVPTSKKKK